MKLISALLTYTNIQLISECSWSLIWTICLPESSWKKKWDRYVGGIRFVRASAPTFPIKIHPIWKYIAYGYWFGMRHTTNAYRIKCPIVIWYRLIVLFFIIVENDFINWIISSCYYNAEKKKTKIKMYFCFVGSFVVHYYRLVWFSF